MKVLVIGGSGKEHALVWKLSQSRHIDKIYCCPGNAGIAEIAECIDVSPRDFHALIDFVKYEWIDLTIIGDEEQSSNGIADIFEREGCKVFGANKISAQLRSSRVAAKNLLKFHGILMPEYKIFTSYILAKDYIRLKGAPIVIKTDSAFAENSIYIAFSVDEALRILRSVMKERILGDAGKKIILEEYLNGQEATLTFLADGKSVRPFASLYKYFRFSDSDADQMAAGIGAYCPLHLEQTALERIHKIIGLFSRALKAEGIQYKGICSLDLIITDRPYVVDVNTCIGELEAQTILPRLKTDFIDIASAIIKSNINDLDIEWNKKASVSVVLYSEDVVANSQRSFVITGLEKVRTMLDTFLFHNNTKFQNGDIITYGGRVMSITATGDRVEDAKTRTYKAIEEIGFEKMHYRKDIGDIKEIA
jgi:phosphoribosylamine--glycine ligase